ncbi:unnamed protein product [Linum trigynum]|uniref:Uncharacterized protein n=1 Tax=Linum trigynum TaxID=586398 RepID=A0AAV2EZ11_9ROSI
MTLLTNRASPVSKPIFSGVKRAGETESDIMLNSNSGIPRDCASIVKDFILESNSMIDFRFPGLLVNPVILIFFGGPSALEARVLRSEGH